MDERPHEPQADLGMRGQQEQSEAAPPQRSENEQRHLREEESAQLGQTPERESAGVAQAPATGRDGVASEGLPLRQPPGPHAGHEEAGEEVDDLPQFSDYSDENSRHEDQDPVGPVLHVVYRFVDGAIQAEARNIRLSFDEQGRLDAEGMGAIGPADVPYVLRTKYGQHAMYVGPRQPAEGQEESGQSRGGSEHGAGSGTFDWHLLPSPAGSRTSE